MHPGSSACDSDRLEGSECATGERFCVGHGQEDSTSRRDAKLEIRMRIGSLVVERSEESKKGKESIMNVE